MNSVQRVAAAVERREPDRVPLDYWAVPEIDQRLMATYKLPDLAAVRRSLRTDMALVRAQMKDTRVRQTGGDDWYDDLGSRLRWTPHAGGGGYWERVTYPLADARTVDDLRSYAWPTVEAFDWDEFSRELDAYEGLALGLAYRGPFEIYWYVRGFEQSLIDLTLIPDLAHGLIDPITHHVCEITEKMVEVADGRAHYLRASDDWGMQTGLLVSASMFREFYKEPTRRWFDSARRHGLWVFYHTDGSVVELLDDFVDLGVQILNPVQTTCAGMDPIWLKREYGDRFCFHGAVDTQRVLPHGTPEEVKRETLRRMAQLGADGGYVVASCHNLQADTPVENVMAMYQTVWEHGWYPLDVERELERLDPVGKPGPEGAQTA